MPPFTSRGWAYLRKLLYSAATSLYLTGHVGCMELLNKDLHLYLRGHVSLVGGWFSPLSTDLWFVKPFPVPTCSFPQYVSYADILCKTQNTRSNTERECEKLSWDTTYIFTYYIYRMEHPALPPKYLNGDVCFLQFNKNTYLAKCSCLVCFSGMQCKFGVVVIVLSYQRVVGPRVTSGAGNLRLCQGKTLALLPPNQLPTPSSPCPLSLPSTHCLFP